MKMKKVVLYVFCLFLAVAPASAASLFPGGDTTARQSEDYQTLYLAVKCLESIVPEQHDIVWNIEEIRKYCAHIHAPTTESISYACFSYSADRQQYIRLVFEISFNDLVIVQIVSADVAAEIVVSLSQNDQTGFSKAKDVLQLNIEGASCYIPCEDFIQLFQGVEIESELLMAPCPYSNNKSDDLWVYLYEK